MERLEVELLLMVRGRGKKLSSNFLKLLILLPVDCEFKLAALGLVVAQNVIRVAVCTDGRRVTVLRSQLHLAVRLLVQEVRQGIQDVLLLAWHLHLRHVAHISRHRFSYPRGPCVHVGIERPISFSKRLN
jgi:hypothetical protein